MWKCCPSHDRSRPCCFLWAVLEGRERCSRRSAALHSCNRFLETIILITSLVPTGETFKTPRALTGTPFCHAPNQQALQYFSFALLVNQKEPFFFFLALAVFLHTTFFLISARTVWNTWLWLTNLNHLIAAQHNAYLLISDAPWYPGQTAAQRNPWGSHSPHASAETGYRSAGTWCKKCNQCKKQTMTRITVIDFCSNPYSQQSTRRWRRAWPSSRAWRRPAAPPGVPALPAAPSDETPPAGSPSLPAWTGGTGTQSSHNSARSVRNSAKPNSKAVVPLTWLLERGSPNCFRTLRWSRASRTEAWAAPREHEAVKISNHFNT